MSARGTEPRTRFGDLLTAEWIKLWSLRSTSVGLAFCALIILGITTNTSVADYRNWPTYSADTQAIFVPVWSMRDAFNDVAGLFLVLAASSIGAITVVGEYSSGMIRTTFAAVPARRSVMAAKVTVVAGVFLAFGTLVSTASFWISQAILSGRDLGIPISYPEAPRAVAASALLAPVSALIGMAIGALVRHTATTIVTTTAGLLLLPRLFESRQYEWVARVHNALPAAAWDRLTQTATETALHEDPFPPTVPGSWIVYAAWALVAAVLTVTVVHRREV
jgi:ABC-2 type transport system permease protein